jgi:glycosyltransferase involved in cell wall biosynthesis
MRIGATFESSGAAWYRGVYPLEEMARRGHEIIWPEDNTGHPILPKLASCDVIYAYRRHEPELLRILKGHASNGVAIVWDNDDNLMAIPRDSPTFRDVGGLRAQQRFSETVKIARLADVVTLTTDSLRERYEAAGVSGIDVIDNQLPAGKRARPRKHDGVVIGWIAGGEHKGDADELRIAETLEALQARHPDLHVETIGLRLSLRGRYKHTSSLHFNDLPAAMTGYDIGLAPLIDIPFNAARSSIKVKEYAASRVPWLASPVGPYLGLGPRQGGRLVHASEWFDALDDLIRNARERKRLAKAGRSWARTQTIKASADQWEAAFEKAAAARRAERSQPQRAARTVQARVR